MHWRSPYFPRSIHTECRLSMNGVEISEDTGVSTQLDPDKPLPTEHHNIFKALRLTLRSHIHPLTDYGFSFGFSPAPTSHESSDGRRPIVYRLSVAIESRISRSRHRAALLRRHIISQSSADRAARSAFYISAPLYISVLIPRPDHPFDRGNWISIPYLHRLTMFRPWKKKTARDTLEASGISLYLFTTASCQKGKWKDVLL
jgi:hypothetical protein